MNGELGRLAWDSATFLFGDDPHYKWQEPRALDEDERAHDVLKLDMKRPQAYGGCCCEDSGVTPNFHSILYPRADVLTVRLRLFPLVLDSLCL